MTGGLLPQGSGGGLGEGGAVAVAPSGETCGEVLSQVMVLGGDESITSPEGVTW